MIGAETWKRKHVDWEIGYSLTTTLQNQCSGLMGILLPSYCCNYLCDKEYSKNGKIYTPCNIPPHLYDNVENGYAKIYSYPFSADDLQQWIDETFKMRKQDKHVNNLDYFKNNRSQDQTHWVD